jgi:hypothetical protein
LRVCFVVVLLKSVVVVLKSAVRVLLIKMDTVWFN